MTQQQPIAWESAQLSDAWRTENGKWLCFLWHDGEGNTLKEALWIHNWMEST